MDSPATAIPILACRGVEKRFGPVIANRDINLEVFPGEVLAILGENGAGKSTLMSVIAGRYHPDKGDIQVDGQTIRFSSPAQALRLGIGMVYQRFMLIDSLTVTENILLAADACERSVSHAKIKSKIKELCQRYDLDIKPDQRVGDLSMGEKQRTEILKLLIQSARLLIFDEPTAVLAQPDIDRFFSIVKQLKKEGCGIIFITHKLDEVFAIADRIAILRKGTITVQIKPDKINNKHELARLMVGREIVLQVEKPPVIKQETILHVSSFTGPPSSNRPTFKDVSFSLNRGEILSIIGVAGNGQASLCKALNSLLKAQSGTVQFLDNTYDAQSWSTNPHAGIAYVPEDRHQTGSISQMNLAENFLLTRLNTQKGFWLNHTQIEKDIEAAIKQYSIVTHSTQTLAGQLSGGNLQKLIFGRELQKSPDLFIAEQPTQGLDITATEEIWQAILAQRQQSAILLFTGDLREALSLSDRIAVMFSGQILEIIDASDGDSVARIGLLMAGVVN